MSLFVCRRPVRSDDGGDDDDRVMITTVSSHYYWCDCEVVVAVAKVVPAELGDVALTTVVAREPSRDSRGSRQRLIW